MVQWWHRHNFFQHRMRVGGDKGLLVQKGEVPSKYAIVLSFLWEHYYVSFGFECPIGVPAKGSCFLRQKHDTCIEICNNFWWTNNQQSIISFCISYVLGEGQPRLNKCKIYSKQTIQLELHDNKLDYEMKNYWEV